MGLFSQTLAPAFDRLRGPRWTPIAVMLAALLALIALGDIAADGRPMVSIGESNDAGQRQELLDLFGVPDDQAVTTVSVADTVAAMEGIYDLAGIESAYSSAALTCAEVGAGLTVTTRHIEVVSPALYAMALVTAGIGDATLAVAAPASAPAQGLTALTGVFRAWDAAACPSARTNETRQRLALEQIARTVQAGQALGDSALTTELVLRAQQTMITRGLSDPAEIDAALATEEAAFGVAIPDDARAGVLDFLGRLAQAKINWGAYADGWTIEPQAGGAGLTMTGVGEAAEQVKAEATAAAAPTATVAASAAAPSATAPAPSPTAAAPSTPPPTATPTSVDAVGEVYAVGDRLVLTHGDGVGPTVSYAVDPTASITRNGEAAALARLRRGDSVTVSIPGGGSAVTRIVATSGAATDRLPLGGLWWLLLPLGIVLPAAVLVGGRWARPFVVRPIESAPTAIAPAVVAEWDGVPTADVPVEPIAAPSPVDGEPAVATAPTEALDGGRIEGGDEPDDELEPTAASDEEKGDEE